MKADQSVSPGDLTVTQLANILGISRVAVYKKIKAGRIKTIRVGNTYIIPKSQVAEIFGKTLSSTTKNTIRKAVKKAVEDYGEVLIKLGNE